MNAPVPGRFEDPPVGAAVDPVSASGELVAAGIPVRRAPPEAVARWMGAGWRDFQRKPAIGLAVGLFCALVGWAIVAAMWNAQSAVLILPLITGFMLAAPVLAVPLYEASRRQMRGQSPGGGALFAGFSRNRWGIGLMSALLMLFFYGWMRVATMIWFLFFGLDLPPIDTFLATALADYGFVVASFGIGAVLSALVFALSAVSLPMLVDRRVDAMTAAMTSLRACLASPLTMALWASLIAILTLIGIGAGLFGLVLVVPVIGHATWHAYAELVGAVEEGAEEASLPAAR
ncbi:DUF2189 domain-containing protein [Sabulicella glaciei]|uniref:DUF2189 domain-containing protein n=1 Tax=Sabulicella glaciei TaxID=2984948 RepID=A0ABT3NXE7_9PROT|nr:DUF2189 domain-containing protein [Roseococcus sp. MDT2-1-1]MCW8086573.1 DUF2189 domain-containing protein [Roseococcus sp. MDT2-1-1]